MSRGHAVHDILPGAREYANEPPSRGRARSGLSPGARYDREVSRGPESRLCGTTCPGLLGRGPAHGQGVITHVHGRQITLRAVNENKCRMTSLADKLAELGIEPLEGETFQPFSEGQIAELRRTVNAQLPEEFERFL